MAETFMHIIDTGLPRFLGAEGSEEKFRVIQDYFILLLEELRFLLRHLGGDNFTEAGAREVVELGLGRCGELYGSYGLTADLTVWALRTDYRKAGNYLAADRSDVHFIRIQGEQIDFVTAAAVDPEETEQLTRDGLPCYWTDGSKTAMTCLRATEWPVTVYRYEEEVQLSLRFMEYPLEGDGAEEPAYGPVIALGPGNGEGADRGYILREQGALVLRFVTEEGETADVALSDFVDAKHRRLSSCEIDTTTGNVTYTVEGDETEYRLTFAVDGDSVTYTWPDGHTCEVTVV